MHRTTLTALVALALTGWNVAQDTPGAPLTHDAYDGWRSLSGQAISNDGSWVATGSRPQVGDGELIVRSTTGATEYRVARGSGPRFTEDGKWVVFSIAPARADKLAFDKAKLAGKAKGKDAPKEPKSGLGIIRLADGRTETFERVKNFKVPKEGPAFVVYHLEKPEKKEKPAEGDKGDGESPKKGRKSSSKKDKDEPAKYLKDGTALVIRNLSTGKETRVEGVVTYGLSPKKGICWFACNSKEAQEGLERGLFGVVLDTSRRTTLVEGAANYGGFVTDRDVTRLAFVSDRRDRDSEKPTHDLYAWDLGDGPAERIVSHADTPDFPDGRSVAPVRTGSSRGGRPSSRRRRGGGGGARLTFSHDGSALMFGATELPKPTLPKLLDEEKVNLDLWHWRDPLLQPMQAKRNNPRPLHCVWSFDDGKLTVVSAKDTEQAAFLTPDGAHVLIHDSEPYAQMVSWDGRYADVYVVDVRSGERSRMVSALRGRAEASPDGKTIAYFRGNEWYAVNPSNGDEVCLTGDLDVRFEREEHDTPEPARAHGIAGWTEDGRVLINDRFDIWVMKPDGSGATRVTDGWGRENHVSLRYTRLDPEQRFIPTDSPLTLAATDTETMATGYYKDTVDGGAPPSKVVMLDQRFSGLTKAKDADRFIFTLSTFRQFGDLWSSPGGFADRSRLTDVNPQQRDYRWGDAELVRWRNADGVELKGFLVKPDGFDPNKQYPMMVYFYEKTSQNLHRYVAPAPGTSPNASYYVSNGYLWFQPDIVYREGYPGESCLKCVVSGVQHLINEGFVDPERIGAAGHSWGGYQTAYLVTRTDIFAAVESGAPVSNMTSAYGGIRWGSGMSRAFQYERTQSRIGGSLWEYPMRYLENSPLFSADKVNTPVLMLHNDEDGAVPWYQGIEFFCALRRLRQEVYMFNYVGGAHGLRRRADQNDWTRRMQQYFDHHLKGVPAPEWMTRGVPYEDRMREKHRFSPPKHPVVPDKKSNPSNESPAGATERRRRR